jgi:hypothetical protein
MEEGGPGDGVTFLDSESLQDLKTLLSNNDL